MLSKEEDFSSFKKKKKKFEGLKLVFLLLISFSNHILKQTFFNKCQLFKKINFAEF